MFNELTLPSLNQKICANEIIEVNQVTHNWM
jgi:hypothetical protein